MSWQFPTSDGRKVHLWSGWWTWWAPCAYGTGTCLDSADVIPGQTEVNPLWKRACNCAVLFETTSNLGRTVLVVVLLIYIYWANSAVQGEGSSWGWRAEKGPGRDFPANSVYASGRKKREKNRKTLLCILATFKVIWWCKLLQCVFLNHISHWCLPKEEPKIAQ